MEKGKIGDEEILGTEKILKFIEGFFFLSSLATFATLSDSINFTRESPNGRL